MTKLYLSRGAAGFAPATIRGAWSRTSDSVTRAMHTAQDAAMLGSSIANTASEASSTSGYTSLILRAVSSPLSANHTFGGTLNLMLAVGENSSNANLAYYLNVFVTQGDSDVARGTLLADYAESTEWPTTPVGRALAAAQSVSSVAALAGDRIVAEIGFTALNTSNLTYTGTLYTGGNGSDLAASGAASSGVGFLDFSDTFTVLNNPTVRAGQLPYEVIRKPLPNAQLSQLGLEVVRRASSPNLRAGQAAIEVLRRNGSVPVTGAQNNMVFVIAG